MTENLANTYQTTINDAGGISSSDTSVTVTSTTGRPSVNFRIKVDDELMLVTAVSSSTFTITRGIEGTTAASHSDGATVTHVLTAGGLSQYVTENAGGLSQVVSEDGTSFSNFTGISGTWATGGGNTYIEQSGTSGGQAAYTAKVDGLFVETELYVPSGQTGERGGGVRILARSGETSGFAQVYIDFNHTGDGVWSVQVDQAGVAQRLKLTTFQGGVSPAFDTWMKLGGRVTGKDHIAVYINDIYQGTSELDATASSADRSYVGLSATKVCRFRNFKAWTLLP